MKRVIYLIFLAFCFSLFISCQQVPLLTLSSTSNVEIGAEGGNASISFMTNREWTANSSNSWISVTPSSGLASDGSITISVKCDANTTYEDRNGVVTIIAEDLTQTVNVKQLANYGIVLATQSYFLSSDRREIEIEVQANVQYSVNISEEWIKLSGTKGLTSSTLVFCIEENTSYDARKASIVLKPEKGGISEQTIIIEQAQKDALILSNEYYNMPLGGGIIEIKVDSNVDFEVNSLSDWIHHTETKALNSSTVCLKVDANASDERYGTVIISQTNGSLSYTITVSQEGSPGFDELFTALGQPAKLYSYTDDWEFLMILFCNDLEGADALIADNGYNWFRVCGDYSSRDNTIRNNAIRYKAPMNMIYGVNTYITRYPENVDDATVINHIAQARVLRAYSYMMLAPQYQFAPLTQTSEGLGKHLPCVPLVKPDTKDYSNNPRASVGEIYDFVLDDLNYAIEKLAGSTRPSKMYIDDHVAHGLRARVNLLLGNWDAAYNDAVAAATGYTPKSIAELQTALSDGTAFEDINEHDWIWGYDMNASIANIYRYATTSSWLRSFSGWAYAPACQVYTCINKILWDKIPYTDIRKQWWVDENLRSSLIVGLTWRDYYGNLHDDVANYSDGGDSKLPFLPYTNVKFGCNPIGTFENAEDMPLMRVEEMILIQAEAKACSGDIGTAISILENFVKTYRDPNYSVAASGRKLLDEIWFQRRVELWGEGFGIFDNLRLNKPIVRSHGKGTSNISETFRFNLESQDPWLRMRFPKGELANNAGLVNNEGGVQPVPDQLPGLRDGVTDPLL